MSKKGKSAFITNHCHQYGLKVVNLDIKGNVSSVACRICLAFGRELMEESGMANNNSKTRQKTKNTK